MRLSTVILPIYRWTEGQAVWRRAEELGFHAAYTYDHLTWQSFRDRAWFGAVPTLAAASVSTHRIRIGTLVTSPNFRHPVTLAKELMSLDDLSAGRPTVGIGSGGTGFDSTALGQVPPNPHERADRFEAFVQLLDQLLTQPSTTVEGTLYAADEARNLPGPVQRPRPPFLVAATGPRALALAARYGQGWVTYGPPGPGQPSATEVRRVIAAQLDGVRSACRLVGRDPTSLDAVLLEGLTSERPMASVDAFVDWAGHYRDLGFNELVVHWPVPDSVFARDEDTFERIAGAVDQL